MSGQIDGPLSLTRFLSLPKPQTSILTENQLLDRLIQCLHPPTVHKTVTSRSTLATTKPRRVSSKAVVDFHSLKVLILNEWKSTAPFLWIRGNVRSALSSFETSIPGRIAGVIQLRPAERMLCSTALGLRCPTVYPRADIRGYRILLKKPF